MKSFNSFKLIQLLAFLFLGLLSALSTAQAAPTVWGANWHGELGDGTTTQRNSPVTIVGGLEYSQISAGYTHTLALRADGTVWSWGNGTAGQLGHDNRSNQYRPVQIGGLNNVASLSAGTFHSLAVKTDGTVWSWGYNDSGQLGHGNRANQYRPVQIGGLNNVASLSAGTFHSLAVKTDGTVWSWGYSLYGQLGHGNSATQYRPVQIDGLNNVASLSAGGYHSLAVKTDGTVWSWGYGSAGQLGHGNRSNQYRPVQIGGLSSTSIEAGSHHSFTYTGGVNNQAPVAHAGANQTLESTGSSSANVTLDGSASSDADGDTLTYAWSWAGGSATGVSNSVSLPLGTTVVTLTVDDGTDSTTDTVSITVQDTTPPTVNAGADVTLESTDAAGAAFSVLDQTTSDDVGCGSPSLSAAPTPAFYPLAGTTVTVTATDCVSLTATDTMLVTVQDTTAPVLTVPANVSVEANAVLSTVAIGSASATDIFAVTVTNDAPMTFPLGDTVVTYTATDGNGLTSTATQTITVTDTTAPVLTVPSAITSEASAVESLIALGTATATDIFGATVTNDAPATFPLGDTVVTYTATDGNGLTSTATQTITVTDTTAPVLTVPSAITSEASAISSLIALGTATATDIFGATVTSDAPATYSLGTTVVTWTATDVNGNVSTATQNVVVVDTTAPVLIAPAAINIEATGAQTPVAIGTATATDIFGFNITNDAPATYGLGTTVVTWTATDVNGNVSTATQNVVVVDTTAPTVTANLNPVSQGDDDHDSDEGRFTVSFNVSDIVDANPTVVAELIVAGHATAIAVTKGQLIEFEYEDEKTEVEIEDGILEIEAPSMVLRITATDASGNVTVVEVQPQGLSRDNDDDYDRNDDHDD
ncbi:MAG: HYR domain-containing protein [Gammaproteobacteria bacterium]|nr:HYR domain-containing protein [Gammaproteobacteria bacterium]